MLCCLLQSMAKFFERFFLCFNFNCKLWKFRNLKCTLFLLWAQTIKLWWLNAQKYLWFFSNYTNFKASSSISKKYCQNQSRNWINNFTAFWALKQILLLLNSGPFASRTCHILFLELDISNRYEYFRIQYTIHSNCNLFHLRYRPLSIFYLT